MANSEEIVVAPYFYSWGTGNSAYKVQSLADAKKKMDLRAVTIAFVISGGTGRVNPEIPQIIPDIVAFRKSGGKVILSFGGANGPYLEESVTSAEDLCKIWEKLIADTGVKHFDFDVEGSYLNQTKLNDLRKNALKMLQSRHPDMYISFTLAVMPPDNWGNASLPADGVKFLQSHITAGIKIDLVNMMTMDYGSSFASKNQGQLAVDCAESLKGQLAKLYPSKTVAQLYRMIGITPMIGKNDDANVFRPDDAETVAKYAKQNNIGLLSYWALQRDQCGSGSLALYSNANKQDFQFFKIFSSACGPAPTPDVKPTPSPAVIPSPAVKPAPLKPVVLVPVGTKQWIVGASYKPGDTVTLNGAEYTCINSHVSQPDWSPDVAQTLWRR